MLQNLSDQIRDCLRLAAECAEQAKTAPSQRERRDWRHLEHRYRILADNIKSSPGFKNSSLDAASIARRDDAEQNCC